MGIKVGIILLMVVTSALLQFYYTSNDYTWFMFYLVIAGLFVSFALSFTAIVVLIRLLKRLEDLLAKLNQLLPESDEELIKSIYTNAGTPKKVTLYKNTNYFINIIKLNSIFIRCQRSNADRFLDSFNHWRASLYI